jgi:hypothetical protein
MDDNNSLNVVPTHVMLPILNQLPSTIYSYDSYDYDSYYNDLSKGWYDDVGYTILIAIVTLISTPIVTILVQKLVVKLKAK